MPAKHTMTSSEREKAFLQELEVLKRKWGVDLESTLYVSGVGPVRQLANDALVSPGPLLAAAQPDWTPLND